MKRCKRGSENITDEITSCYSVSPHGPTMLNKQTNKRTNKQTYPFTIAEFTLSYARLCKPCNGYMILWDPCTLLIASGFPIFIWKGLYMRVESVEFIWNWTTCFSKSRGATWTARGGIRLIHGLTKSTLITYYSGMKKDHKYAFLHAFCLICLSCSFQNLSIWPKTHLFSNFARFCTPKRCTRIQCLVLKNNPNYVNFGRAWYPPSHFEWPPGVVMHVLLNLSEMW